MRPLRRPSAPAGLATFPLHDLLLQALGSYCSLCENWLSDICWGWNARSRLIAGLHVQPATWDQLLLVCQNCREAAQASRSSRPLLLPDRDLTFRVRGDSPFLYRLQTIERVELDDDGKPLGAPEKVERVLVEGTTSEAQATIAYFALNTAYYDPAARILRVPRVAALSALDRRLELRTNAWQAATRYVEVLKSMQGSDTARLVEVPLRHAIATQGFWSTWATVLWQELRDEELLARVLLPPAATATRTGKAQSFPATRSDWLA